MERYHERESEEIEGQRRERGGVLLFALQSMSISIGVPCLETAEFPDRVRRFAQ